MCCSTRGLVLAAVVFAAVAACGRRTESRPERVAILRFENLGTDPAHDWIGRAMSDAISTSLAGAPGVHLISPSTIRSFDRVTGPRPVQAPGISSERTQALLAGATQLGYGRYDVRGGKIRAHLTIESAATNRTLMSIEASGAESDVVDVAEALARQINPKASPYGTRNEQAVRQYAMALEARSAEEADQALGRALAADPQFGAAALMLARLKSATQDRAGAESVLRRALAGGEQMPAAERARLQLELAALRGDREGRKRALEALAKATPDDPAVWRASAETALARHDYRGAVEALRHAVAAEPEEPSSWNLLGYAAVSAGDLKGATDALERYRALRPGEANPLDSMGDVHFQVGRFAEAENWYLQAHQKDPAFLGGGTLYKAAMARLATGDVSGADELAKRYIEARQAAGDPAVELRRADWLWTSGRRKQGYERLAGWAAGLASPARGAASISRDAAAMAAYAGGSQSGPAPRSPYAESGVVDAGTVESVDGHARAAAGSPPDGASGANGAGGFRRIAAAPSEARAAQRRGPTVGTAPGAGAISGVAARNNRDAAASAQRRDLAARAYAQLAIWSLGLGDRAKAHQMADRAAGLATAGSAGLATMARFLALPPAPASEWAVRAERAFPEPSQTSFKNFARAYALLLARDWQPAATLLREMYQAGGTVGDQTLAVLLGWAYLESGKTAEAAPLVARFPSPPHEGLAPFSMMHWPRIFQLRALAAERQGQADAARESYRVFAVLSGPDPLVWGEEKAARR